MNRKLLTVLGQKLRTVSSFQLILFGFMGIILTGALLLTLPIASADGHSAGFLTGLFTSTSATCVTGLVVRDTATGWSFFGQIVILILIQTGGLGVILAASMVAMASGKKIGLMQRSTLRNAVGAPHVGGIVKFGRFILRLTITFELVGACLMMPVFIRDFGIRKGIWYGLFHSISAFCNAGFDLMGIRGHYSSLMSYRADPLILITIMLLIIFGGLGFLTWTDIFSLKKAVRRYRVQSRIILIATVALIIVPTVFFYFNDFADLSGGQRLLTSAFQAVTPRTAGFNSASLGGMTDPGKAVLIMLMLIGGAPGSTAGGMKVTTFVVIILSTAAVWKRQHETNCLNRSIKTETIRQALSIFFMYLMLFLVSGIMISMIEHLPLGTCLFEVASAIGTVGLTLGITPTLGTASRIILIILMYFGRVGGLTLIFAVMPETRKGNGHMLSEQIIVG